MYNTPEYTSLINVAKAYKDMREGAMDDDDGGARKIELGPGGKKGKGDEKEPNDGVAAKPGAPSVVKKDASKQKELASKAKAKDPANKADAEAERRRNLRKPIGGKLDKVVKDVQGKNLSSAADKVIKDVQGEDKKKKEAEERRARLKDRFGGRQGRIARRPGQDMAADDYMAMDGNKRAAKRVMDRAKIDDAKQEGEERKKEGK